MAGVIEFRVEVRCPKCQWLALLPDDGVNFPCERCDTPLSVREHGTSASFRARAAKLLREIEWSGGCCGGKKCPVEECTDGGGGCGQKSHAPDCALAALLREAEAP